MRRLLLVTIAGVGLVAGGYTRVVAQSPDTAPHVGSVVGRALASGPSSRHWYRQYLTNPV